jgi:AcrR family transcriptional regulator
MVALKIMRPSVSFTLSGMSGLRERKKERTRQQIADAAWELFAARGFDRVTVSEVARAADVSEATAFNYFATKEDLVYHRMRDFEEELLAAVQDRAEGVSVVEAFGEFVLRPRGFLVADDERAREGLATVTRVITGSPALLTREREILEGYTVSLAALIAAESGMPADAIEPWVAANALIGVHRALLGHVRRRVLEGAPHAAIADELASHGRAALAMLGRGLASGTD